MIAQTKYGFKYIRAATLFRPVTGISARNLYLYPLIFTFPSRRFTSTAPISSVL